METKIIARVNNVDIISTGDEQLVAIKPICEAIGIDWEGQRQRIERDEILGSVACMIKAIAYDGKKREMFCLPLMYVLGWIFSDDIRLAVVPSRIRELHNALWKYFDEKRNTQTKILRSQEQRIEELRRENAKLEQYYENEMLLEAEI